MSVTKVLGRLLFCGLAIALAERASANQIEAAVEGELLKVFGDNAANGVAITQTARGDLVVRGFNGTTVNGQGSVRFRGVTLNAVEILLEGGNDVVRLRGLSPANDLFVNLGAGNDRLTTPIPISVGANAAIEGGDGNDRITMTDPVIGEDLVIEGGIGSLTVNITGLTGGKGLTVIGDDANDSITVSDFATADYTSIETKGGADSVTLSTASVFGLDVSTDFGADTVAISDLTSIEDLGIFTGTESDGVDLLNVAVGKSITVSVDDGPDVVSAEAVSATEDAVFEGGAGDDTIVDLGITGGTKKDIKEFETFLP